MLVQVLAAHKAGLRIVPERMIWAMALDGTLAC